MSAANSLLVSAPAVQQLQAGCVHLGLPPSTAVELVRFLTLKRLISLRSPSSKRLDVSPGYQLDRLWHWMLLNTEVARAVHALVGDEVEHATTDVVPLGDDTKMLRRLLALNLMVREGWAPDLTLWQEPGTVMADIIQMPLPGDVTPLYISRATTPQQQQLLLADLLAATEGAAAKAPDHVEPAPAAAMPAEAAAAPSAASGQAGPAGAGLSGRKRPHLGEEEDAPIRITRQQQKERKPLNLFVEDAAGMIVAFKVSLWTHFQKITKAYADHKGLDAMDVRLFMGGDRLDPYKSPADYGLQDGDTLTVFRNLTTC